MKPWIKFCLLNALATLLLGACKEKDVIPTADFETDFANDYSTSSINVNNIPRYATFEPIRFINKSINGEKYSWEFSNGQNFTEKEPVLNFEQGGEYAVKLTVQSPTGNRSEITKTIKIYERYVHNIYIHLTTWGYNLYSLEEMGWTDDRVSDILLEIGVMGQSDYLYPSTILYTSDTIKNISITSPIISLALHDDIKIDYKLLTLPGIVIQLYDVGDGSKKLFYSSEYFPGLTSYLDYTSGFFKLESGFVKIDCVFK